jgi:hypothetical protein
MHKNQKSQYLDNQFLEVNRTKQDTNKQLLACWPLPTFGLFLFLMIATPPPTP